MHLWLRRTNPSTSGIYHRIATSFELRMDAIRSASPSSEREVASSSAIEQVRTSAHHTLPAPSRLADRTRA